MKTFPFRKILAFLFIIFVTAGSRVVVGGLSSAASAGSDYRATESAQPPSLRAAEPATSPGIKSAAFVDDNEDAINPTGGPVRTGGMDKWGSGEYLAPRNDPWSEGRTLHYAIDYVGRPGQAVAAPISGKLRRHGSGLTRGASIVGYIKGRKHKVKLLHFNVTVKDGFVSQGDPIGKVLDLGRHYPGMTSHVHMEVHEWRRDFGYREKDPSLVVRP